MCPSHISIIHESEEDRMMLILLTVSSEYHDLNRLFLLGGHFAYSLLIEFIVGCVPFCMYVHVRMCVRMFVVVPCVCYSSSSLMLRYFVSHPSECPTLTCYPFLPAQQLICRYMGKQWVLYSSSVLMTNSLSGRKWSLH